MIRVLPNSELIYIFELDGMELEEKAIVSKQEGNKIYCTDSYGKRMIFNAETGYCYTYNPAHGAKQYLKI